MTTQIDRLISSQKKLMNRWISELGEMPMYGYDQLPATRLEDAGEVCKAWNYLVCLQMHIEARQAYRTLLVGEETDAEHRQDINAQRYPGAF